jgi:hypothetical protein
MEETLGENVVRYGSILVTFGCSVAACLVSVYNQDINSGTPMTLLTHQRVPTGFRKLFLVSVPNTTRLARWYISN